MPQTTLKFILPTLPFIFIAYYKKKTKRIHSYIQYIHLKFRLSCQLPLENCKQTAVSILRTLYALLFSRQECFQDRKQYNGMRPVFITLYTDRCALLLHILKKTVHSFYFFFKISTKMFQPKRIS